jgi:CheY-like chemotaxis protein
MTPRGSVLLVEDNAGTQAVIETLLEAAGHEVEAEGTVTAARQRLIEMRPDLILMDIGLPDGDGLALTSWIKKNERTKSIPVVALTGHVSLKKSRRGY